MVPGGGLTSDGLPTLWVSWPPLAHPDDQKCWGHHGTIRGEAETCRGQSQKDIWSSWTWKKLKAADVYFEKKSGEHVVVGCLAA